MANIIFTNSCNINCPFCFASENNEGDSNILADFDLAKTWEITSFLNRKYFRFCGGEPTLSKHVIKSLDILLKHDYDILFMTNGIWTKPFRNYIKSLSPKHLLKVHYLFNILHPSFYKNGELKEIEKTMSVIHSKNATLGITIYKNTFNYKYILEYADKYNIDTIRWSVAAPNISNNLDLLEIGFDKIADIIYKLSEECRKRDIDLRSDCNYIQPCFYNKDELTEMLISSKNRIRFSCRNSSPVDIGADGSAWRCYGLYSVLRTSIKNFLNESELEKYFTRRVRILSNLLPFSECKECLHWQNGCDGGCYVYRIKKALKQKPDLVLFPIDDNTEILNCIPYINKAVTISKEQDDYAIFLNDKVIINPDENMTSFLTTINGKLSIKNLIELWKDNYSNHDIAKTEVINQFRELFEKDMVDIKYNYNIAPDSRPICKN